MDGYGQIWFSLILWHVFDRIVVNYESDDCPSLWTYWPYVVEKHTVNREKHVKKTLNSYFNFGI